MNNNLFELELIRLLKDYAISAMSQTHPNEAKLVKLIDKLKELLQEMKNIPMELQGEAQNLMAITIAKEYKLI